MEVILKIDPRKKEAKALLEFIKNLPYVSIEVPSKKVNAITKKAMDEAKKGNLPTITLAAFKKQLYA